MWGRRINKTRSYENQVNEVKEFSYKTTAKDNALLVSVHNSINEEFEIPLKEFENHKNVLIDLSRVGMINSEGTRRFSKWLFSIEETLPNVQVKLEKLQPVIVRQFNLILTYFGKNVEISSIFVPYYCQHCDKDDNETLVTLNQLGGSVDQAAFNLQSKPCKKCGSNMEPDVNEKYLFILKK